MIRSIRNFLLFVLLLALFGTFLFWPIAQTVRVGFQGVAVNGVYGHFTFGYVLAVFRDPNLRAGLLNSATIAISVTLLCTIVSVPLALLSRRYDFYGKSVVSGLLLVPLILPPFVGAIGMRQVLGRFGVLTAAAHGAGWVGANTPVDWFGGARILGVILIESLSLYPILYLNLAAALANLDPAMEQAAANLGAGRWRIFRKVTLPLMRPGLFAGGTIVLIWSFTELGTPLMFDLYRVTPVQVFDQLNQVAGSPLPYALVVVMLFASITLYILGKFVLGQKQAAAVTKGGTQGATIRLGVFRSIPVLIPFLLVGGLALVPHVAVVLMSCSKVGAWYQSAVPRVFTGEHYRNALTYDVTLPSVWNSVFYATFSMIVDVVLGLAIAFLVVRSKLPRFFRQGIDSLAMLPLAVPGLVLAFGFIAISLQLQVWVADPRWLEWLGRQGGLGAWLQPHVKFHLPQLRDLVNVQQNPTVLLIVAYAMRRLPYVVRSSVAGLEQTPVDLELAARNLGASSGRTLWKISLPLISANLVAGGLLAFAFAMLEVSDSLILAQKQNYWPITKAIYELFQRLGDGPYVAAALGVWAMLLLTLTILSANSLLGKKMGAVFRV